MSSKDKVHAIQVYEQQLRDEREQLQQEAAAREAQGETAQDDAPAAGVNTPAAPFTSLGSALHEHATSIDNAFLDQPLSYESARL